MKALVVEKPGSAELDELARPEVGATDVLVRVRQAGICGSDVEILNGTRPTDPTSVRSTARRRFRLVNGPMSQSPSLD